MNAVIIAMCNPFAKSLHWSSISHGLAISNVLPCWEKAKSAYCIGSWEGNGTANKRQHFICRTLGLDGLVQANGFCASQIEFKGKGIQSLPQAHFMLH